MFFPYSQLLKDSGLSERKFSRVAGLSRSTIRKLSEGDMAFNLGMLERAAGFFGYVTKVLTVPNERVRSEYSTVAVSYLVIRDDFESWKIHFMNLVDEFRSGLDVRLLLLPPPRELDFKLQSLLASIVCSLCDEIQMSAPEWSRKIYYLDRPWFVAGVESLKATALLESPRQFRRNNIFVQENFLSRV